jgi:hypothetical protein
MTAMLFNVPVIVSGAGWAVPAAFIVALIMLLVFTVGYVEMAKRVTSAGGFYSFVSHGFGQTMGLGTASVITFSYTILTASIVGIFAYFAQTTIQDWTHADIPILALLLFAVVVNVLFAYFDIKITARVLGTFFVAEVGVLLIFAIAVLVQGGADGLTAAPFNPVKLFNNHAAIAVFGAAAPGVALFGAFWSWVGFEMATNYGEESRQPKQIFSGSSRPKRTPSAARASKRPACPRARSPACEGCSNPRTHERGPDPLRRSGAAGGRGRGRAFRVSCLRLALVAVVLACATAPAVAAAVRPAAAAGPLPVGVDAHGVPARYVHATVVVTFTHAAADRYRRIAGHPVKVLCVAILATTHSGAITDEIWAGLRLIAPKHRRPLTAFIGGHGGRPDYCTVKLLRRHTSAPQRCSRAGWSRV